MEKVYNMEIAGLKRSLKLYKVCRRAVHCGSLYFSAMWR